MPNVNPRLQVILPREVHAVIAKLARLRGVSQSAVARDFLTEVAPVLARVAETLEAAAKLDERGRAKFIRALEAQQGTLEAQAQRALDLFDGLAPKGAGGRRKRSDRRPPPPRRSKTPVQ